MLCWSRTSRSLTDADGLDNAIGTDMMLGVVDSSGMVALFASNGMRATTPGGVDLAYDPDSANNENLVYQWGMVTTDADGDETFNVIPDATDPIYTVATALGSTIRVRVTIRDDAHGNAGTDAAHTEMADSSNAVEVKVLVSFGKAEYVVQEGKTVNVQLTLSNEVVSGTVTVNLVTDPAEGDLVDSVRDSVPFTGTDLSKTFAYTAPTDGSGTRSFVISIVATGDDGLPDTHVLGEHGSTTIRITDEMNSKATRTSFTIDDMTPTVGDTLTATLSGLEDADGLNDSHPVTFKWTVGDREAKTETKMTKAQSAESTYTVASDDFGMVISVEASFTDNSGYSELLPGEEPTDAVASLVTDRPDGTAKISRIAPTIRGITVSSGDTVTLSVDIYGLQNVKDNGIGGNFVWSVNDETDGDLGSGREADYTATSSPGKYTITAELSDSQCLPDVSAGETDAERAKLRDAACSAEFEVTVRRPSAAGPEQPAPANPPGEIPSILADSDGNQYEVFTPVEGGTFTGEGYSLTVDAGAVPNGEFLGIRMSDEGAASNARHDAPALHARWQHVRHLRRRRFWRRSKLLRPRRPGVGLRAAPGRVAVEHLRPCGSCDQQRWLADDPRRSGADQLRSATWWSVVH